MKESSTPRNATPAKVILKQENDSMRTPRVVKAIIPSRSPSPSSSIEVMSNDEDDIIDVSSGDISPPPTPQIHVARKIVKQSTLDSHINKNINNSEKEKKQDKPIDVIEVLSFW